MQGGQGQGIEGEFGGTLELLAAIPSHQYNCDS
jgi:hypothetical protein